MEQMRFGGVKLQSFAALLLVTATLGCERTPPPASTQGYLPNTSPAEVKEMQEQNAQWAAQRVAQRAAGRTGPGTAGRRQAVASNNKPAPPRLVQRRRMPPPTPHSVAGQPFLRFDAGTKLPPFVVVQRDKPLPLAGRRKKPMLLHLWASWCGPCVKELPELLHFGKKGLVDVVAVSVDDRWPDVVKYFQNNIPAEIAWDPKITLEPGLGVRSLPTTFLVDQQGRLRLRWNGMQNWTSSQIYQSIQKELARVLPAQ